MEALSLTNFKSYRKHNIFGFNPQINVIIGGNGQGKSNIFKGLSFVLSDRLQINRTQFHNCVHRGVDLSEDSEIQVEVILREKYGMDEFVKITKIWKPNLTEECYVNSKTTNKKQYENFIDGLSLSYTNPYNIVQQGKITQITLMDQFQLYKLLEEITGVKKFNKRKEEALNILKKVDQQKQETKVILLELDEKLKSLQSRKQQFEFFAVQQKTKKYRTKKHLTELLEGTKHNLEKIKNQYDELLENFGKVIFKRRAVEQSMEENIMALKTGKQKLALVDRANVIGQTQVPQTQQIKDLQKRQKQLHKQLKQYAKQIKEKDKQVEIFKKGFVEVQQSYETMKLSKQLTKPKQSKQKVIQAFQEEIKAQQRKLTQSKSESQKLDKKISEIQKQLAQKKNSEAQQQHSRLQQELQTVKQSTEEKKKLIAQLNWQRNIINIQCESGKEAVQQLQNKMKKVLPYLDFHLLDYLKKQNIKGVYGYFVQFVDIDPSVCFAYEIAGMNKLCSLLVENQEACIAVIQANKKIKGRQINIVQLDYIRSRPAQSANIPKSLPSKKLSNQKWIKIRTNLTKQYSSQTLADDIQKLIKNTFQKYALVKDYDTGLKISKEYQINCITGDRQIIYSQGYHCKLGQDNLYNDSLLAVVGKFMEKREFYLGKIGEKRDVQGMLMSSQNQEVECMNQQHKIQMQLNRLSNIVTQLKTQRKLLQTYIKTRQQMHKNYLQSQSSLKNKKQALSSLLQSSTSKSKPDHKYSNQQYTQIQQSYNEKRRQFNRMLKQIYEIEQKMQVLDQQKQQLDDRIIKIKNNKNIGIINPSTYAEEIQHKLAEKEREIANQQVQIQELTRLEKQIQGNKNHVEVKLITYRAEEEDIQNRIADIGEIDQNIDELEELSNSMSVSHMHGRRKNQHYSAKDKLLFTKFSNILDSFTAHKKTFKELEESEQKIRRLISRYQNQSEQYISHIGEKFEKQFVDIFKSIVNQGNAEVRLKKISEKIKDVIKYRNCLTIKVSFSHSSEAMKKFSDFSGGQKTVIAISMILALQRCEPAPFYILDEVDSALDSVFVQKIVELLAKQSHRNKCQYFISSFKEDMMSFPDQICNYYLVHNENRESIVEWIKQSKAIDALRSIVMKKMILF